MIQNTITKIEKKIRKTSSFTDQNKIELLDLLATLKNEMRTLSEEQTENGKSMIGFIDHLTHVAMRQEKNPETSKSAMDGLSESVKGFEVSHPKLVENINFIATSLANIGI
jgi:CRISPR/Cas system CSM-associated protein Csm4 (group 5 of RAMP superfamily)